MNMPSPRKLYPTVGTDEEWAFVVPSLTLMTQDAPQRTYALREVSQQTQRLIKTGVFDAMVQDLCALLKGEGTG